MEFQFVNSTITCPTVPQDLAVRSLIRKQAMKKASAARKRDGNYGKHNLRQYPVFLSEPDSFKVETTTEVKISQKDPEPDSHHQISAKEGTRKVANTTACRLQSSRVKVEEVTTKKEDLSDKLPWTESISANTSAVGYELTSMKTNFDLLILSTLATFHISRTIRATLSQHPQHLILQLRSHKRWSYLSFLPARYEDITCLRDATDCVISRMRHIISSDSSLEPIATRNYVKALRSLQKALDCPKQRLQPEVLCATEVLALYEVSFLHIAIAHC